jgi:hypothetical protein
VTSPPNRPVGESSSQGSKGRRATRLSAEDFPSGPGRRRGKPPPVNPLGSHRQLVEDLASGIEYTTLISGSITGAPKESSSLLVERAHLGNEAVAIHKVFNTVEEADKEEIIALVGQAYDARIPPVVRTEENEVYVGFIHGRPAATLAETGLMMPYVASWHGMLLALVDSVTGNWDRNPANWFIDIDDVVAGCDHASAEMLTENPHLGGETPPVNRTSESIFARHWFITRDPPYADEWKNNPLHPSDVDHWISCTEDLYTAFDQRADWFEAIIGRLEAIRAHAKGPRPCLPSRTLHRAVTSNLLNSASTRIQSSSGPSQSPRKGR